MTEPSQIAQLACIDSIQWKKWLNQHKLVALVMVAQWEIISPLNQGLVKYYSVLHCWKSSKSAEKNVWFNN